MRFDASASSNPTLSFNVYPPEVSLGGDVQFSIICNNGDPGMFDQTFYFCTVRVYVNGPTFATTVWDGIVYSSSAGTLAASYSGSFQALPASIWGGDISDNPEYWTDNKRVYHIECTMVNQDKTVTRTVPITYVYNPETYDLLPYVTENYDFTDAFSSFAHGVDSLPNSSFSISRSAADFIRAGFDVFPSIIVNLLVAVLVIRVVRMVLLKK